MASSTFSGVSGLLSPGLRELRGEGPRMAEAIAMISSVVLQGVFTDSGQADTIFKTLQAVKTLIFRK